MARFKEIIIYTLLVLSGVGVVWFSVKSLQILEEECDNGKLSSCAILARN